MRILSITAGAAGMYCGSCFRDNALASELLARGHDVVLLPLYTPTRTDEPNVSHRRVFFGGVSVYLQQHVPLFRRTPWLLDRLWDSPFVLNTVSRRGISTAPAALGELTVSMLRGEEGAQHKELDKLIHWLRGEPAPDVIDLPNSLLIGLAKPMKEALRRPICCTLQGEDLFLRGLAEPYRSEAHELIRHHVAAVDGFTAVSEYYASFMRDYLSIPRDKIHVVPLGIRLDGYDQPRQPASDAFVVGYFARIAPEKGLHVLCEAYNLLRHERGLSDARLEVAGYLGPEHREYLKRIEGRMQAWGLEGEFVYRGALDRQDKIAFLRSLSVFSVPATYDEPKGMSVLEAMACGVPVVQPRRGAFTEIVERTSGGILVEADNPASLADGIVSLWRNPVLAENLGGKAAAGVRTHYSVQRMADRALEVYASLARTFGSPKQ